MGEERSENDQTMGGKFTVQALAQSLDWPRW